MDDCVFHHGDCLDVLRSMEDDSVDLTLCSPPYENARSYGVGFDLKGQDWVDWSVARYVECVRVSRGLVAWVVEGRTSDFRWTATPALLMADLHRAGVRLRKPPIYQRVGIPGSGGPDWLRNDYETIICASKGRLPWSDNTACGEPPKYAAGGNPSHHAKDGRVSGKPYKPPAISNPGNVIKCHGGGGHMGSSLAAENEAAYPEKLAEFFVRSFCPPGGTVLDIFSGSGTTLAVAIRHGRKAIGVDVRGSQVELSGRRVVEARQRGCVMSEGSENVD